MPTLRILITRVVPDLRRKERQRQSDGFDGRHPWLELAGRHPQHRFQRAGDAVYAAGPASNRESTTCGTFGDGISRAPSPRSGGRNARLARTVSPFADLLACDRVTTSIKTGVRLADNNEAVRAVKRWLRNTKNDRWLVLYNNYDKPTLGGDGNGEPNKGRSREMKRDGDANVAKGYDIRPFLPDAHHGAILITTRSSRVPNDWPSHPA
jgi:hypothetical protein